MGSLGSKELPLSGVNVVDFSHIVAGPFSTQILGDLGASITKIESIGVGDGGRHLAPFINGQSHYFLTFNRNKKSIAVNLKYPKGKEIALRLIKQADVLVENFAPGVMTRFGFDYETLSKINPQLIYCSVSGFGQSGLLADKKSFDPIAQGYAGVMSANGEPDAPPLKVGIPIGDTTAGLFATIAVLSALLKRNNTGCGTRLDTSMYDCLLAMLANHGGYYLASGKQAERRGSQHYFSVPNGVFKAKDGFLVIAAATDDQWRKLCQAFDLMDYANDSRYATGDARAENRDGADALVNNRLSQMTVVDALQSLEQVGVPCAPVQSIGEALEHPYVKERGMLLNLDHPVYGQIRTTGSPLGADLTRDQISAPPVLGEHTEDVLLALDYSPTQIATLLKEEVVATADIAK